MLGEMLNKVRETTPLVHNITNYVTVNDVANVLLACGGSPISCLTSRRMWKILLPFCGGLNINIGTLNMRSIEGMKLAGKKAAELGHAILLDPVRGGSKCTAHEHSRFSDGRNSVFRDPWKYFRNQDPGIRQWYNEQAWMLMLADAVTEENLDEAVAFAKAFAEKANCVVAITGAIDLVSDGKSCYVIRNGRPEMGKITGTGCQLSGMMTAYITANPEHTLEAAAAAVCVMGLAGEIGFSRMQDGDGNSTYRNRIIDAIYNMDAKTLEEGAKYELR